DKGTLKVGSAADITIIDPHKQWTVNKNTFKSKGKNTPFHGIKLTGKAEGIFVKGKYIFCE
ncbi:MAG: dihydroorotase, partial [Clostridia bacterium]|nr:dihydroorotase [Clostridia bacterium]